MPLYLLISTENNLDTKFLKVIYVRLQNQTFDGFIRYIYILG
jgi:hypothetical protein